VVSETRSGHAAGVPRTSAINDALADVIRRRRLELGLTQEQLTEKTDLHRNYLSGIERGAHNIGVSNLVTLAKALQTTASALLAEAEARAGSTDHTSR
jgi:transcriptional regulator with XRE-family HTH domain